jgi:hypothetical protein
MTSAGLRRVRLPGDAPLVVDARRQRVGVDGVEPVGAPGALGGLDDERAALGGERVGVRRSAGRVGDDVEDPGREAPGTSRFWDPGAGAALAVLGPVPEQVGCEEGLDLSSMSGILADSSYRLLPA